LQSARLGTRSGRRSGFRPLSGETRGAGAVPRSHFEAHEDGLTHREGRGHRAEHGEAIGDVAEIVKEVRDDVKDIKGGLEKDVGELKEGLREVKET
jgi:hypothetical protein